MISVIPFTARQEENTSASFPEPATFSRAIGFSSLLKLAVNIAESFRRQRMIAELQALDDRHLKDIGIARCEIWYRVNHPNER